MKVDLLFLGFLILITSFVFFLVMTGHLPRSYKVFDPNRQIEISGVFLTVEEVAKRYKPHFYMRSDTFSPPALMLWWHAIDDQENRSLVLIYHVLWEDEIHPNPIIHNIYRLYRALYYGIPVRDIEYVQINISYEDGSIRRVRYEGTFSDDYYAPIHKHKMVLITSDGNNATEYMLQNDGSVQLSRKIPPPEKPLCFGVVSWSHQFVLLNSNKSSYDSKISIPLKFLSDEEYQKYKFARRSQGDFVSREDSLVVFMAGFLFFFLLGIPYTVWRLYFFISRRFSVFSKR